MKILIIIISALLLTGAYFGGFFVGRKTLNVAEKVVYIKGDPVTGTITNLTPVSETIPDNPVLPLLRDTVYLDNIIYVHSEVDTAAIINDYIARREYAPLLFDTPTLGKLSLSATVQYNKLSDVQYEFVPVYKEITKYRSPIWQPFLSASYSTFYVAGVGGGVFYRNFGAEYQYQRRITDGINGHFLGLKYKF